ncbi:MAG: 1-acyl-sn-glycerol-3-phosphate acyltransferase [Butyricicoccus sp.]|nr:1-acyl-sn-glycerol-3-phosphate acyltransferase [Butyricicoccus sp.]
MKSPKFHPWFQSLAIAVVRVTFKLFYGYRVIGRENAPEGACVVVSNHVQNSDPCFIVISTGNSTLYRAMGKKELFEIPFVNRLVTWLGAFPVDRSKADMNAIRSALRAVQEGNRLLIFPQGTRGSEDTAAKSGAAMIAVRTKAPVLPIYLSENKKFWSRPCVVIGEPYYPEQTRDYDKVAEDMMRRIYALREEIR